MAIGEFKDVESGETNGLEELEKPLIVEEKVIVVSEDEEENNGSMVMVLLSTLVAVFGSFEFGSCVGYSTPTESAIKEDLKLSTAEFSMFGSIITVGAMIGAITSGRISDFIGRKGAMRTSAVFCITGWLAVFFSGDALSLDIGRFFTGYGIGVFSYVIPIFIAEIAPKNLHGGLTTLNQLMIVVGSCVSVLIGAVTSWRVLALTRIVPCVILHVGLCFVPESPRWLAKVGREKEFRAALQKLRGKHADITCQAAAIQIYNETLQSQPKARIFDLFDRKYIRSVIIGVMLMVFQQFGGINGIGFYVSETFESAGLSSGKIGTIAYACVQAPITAIGVVLMDKSGRKPLIMAHGLMHELVPILAVSGVLMYISAFSIGMGAVPWVIMSEIFPINIKGIGGSLVVLVNWLGAWIVSYTFNFLMTWSSSGAFFVYSAFSLLSILFVIKFVPETKGKNLEQIQESINS